MNETQRLALREGLRRHMRGVAKNRRCPDCERGMALAKHDLEDGVAFVCRWDDCGFSRGALRYVGAFVDHGKKWDPAKCATKKHTGACSTEAL